jgi:hypothetical protein
LSSQAFLNLVARERSVLDVLDVQAIALIRLALEHTDLPDDDRLRIAGLHVQQKEVSVAEPLNCGRVIAQGRKPALGVDVKDENATVSQVLVRSIEQCFPLSEARR